MNYIITKHPEFFSKIGNYDFCELEDMILPEKIAIDTETTGLRAREEEIFCTQIGTGNNNYIIHMYDDNYSFKDLIPYIEGKILVGHNILFDLGFFYKYDFWPREVRDTMLATKILYNGQLENWVPFKADFGSVMKRELNIIYDKTEQKNIHKVKLSQPTTIEYSFNDVDKLLELERTLNDKIIKGGFEATYKLHCRYVRALAYMEQCGMPISPQSWENKMIDDLENSNTMRTKVEEYIFDYLPEFRTRQLSLFDDSKEVSVNTASPKQMLSVFKGFDINIINKEGKPSIKEEVITRTPHQFNDIWLAYQEATHRVTTFGDTIYKRIENNRIYTNFNPMVDTARLSTRKGEINFLNFPSDKITRYCFKANEGNVMIVCDYSGQETVIAADLSGDEAMTKSVLDGSCLHCAFARILFPELESLSDEEITKKHKDKRQAAKSPRFAFQYGGSAFTIHVKEGIPMKRAQEIEDGFKALHAGLYTWGDKVFEQAAKKGYIESVDGWKLALPYYEDFKELKTEVDAISREEWTKYKIGKTDYKKFLEEKEKGVKYDLQYPIQVEFYKSKKKLVSKYAKLRSEYMRLCLNNPVQTRGAHQIKLATAILFDWIVGNDLQWKVLICNSIHDELVVECINAIKHTVKGVVEQSMLDAGNHYLNNLKIKADANIGESWGEAK
ncbi:MAG: hypothetical protein EHM25_10480 [Nitrosopumilales archaeon]|nr:MAG: hypothetical protein EHM25_10480 [Nitrosopumilales archaeon]